MPQNYNESLIEQLEAQSYMGKRKGFSQRVIDLDIAIAIVREHQAEQPQAPVERVASAVADIRCPNGSKNIYPPGTHCQLDIDIAKGTIIANELTFVNGPPEDLDLESDGCSEISAVDEECLLTLIADKQANGWDYGAHPIEKARIVLDAIRPYLRTPVPVMSYAGGIPERHETEASASVCITYDQLAAVLKTTPSAPTQQPDVGKKRGCPWCDTERCLCPTQQPVRYNVLPDDSGSTAKLSGPAIREFTQSIQRPVELTQYDTVTNAWLLLKRCEGESMEEDWPNVDAAYKILEKLARQPVREPQHPDDCRNAFEEWCKGKLDPKRTGFNGAPYAYRDTAIAYQAYSAGWNERPSERKSVDRWELAKWLYDFEAEVDLHGVQLQDWECREQKIRDAYYTVAGDCLEAISDTQRRDSDND